MLSNHSRKFPPCPVPVNSPTHSRSHSSDLYCPVLIWSVLEFDINEIIWYVLFCA